MSYVQQADSATILVKSISVTPAYTYASGRCRLRCVGLMHMMSVQPWRHRKCGRVDVSSSSASLQQIGGNAEAFHQRSRFSMCKYLMCRQDQL